MSWRQVGSLLVRGFCGAFPRVVIWQNVKYCNTNLEQHVLQHWFIQWAFLGVHPKTFQIISKFPFEQSGSFPDISQPIWISIGYFSIFSNSGEECVREGRRGWQSPRGTQSQSQSPRPLKGSWGRGRPTVEVQRPTFEEHTWAGQKFTVEVQRSTFEVQEHTWLSRTLRLRSYR